MEYFEHMYCDPWPEVVIAATASCITQLDFVAITSSGVQPHNIGEIVGCECSALCAFPALFGW